MDTDVCIAGGGPAGMMAGLLFARAGLRTTVLEKHGDFLRDFRGDTVHPSTLNLLEELRLLRPFLERPHDKVRDISVVVNHRTYDVVDFRHLRGKTQFIAMMPQWEFLDFLAQSAKAYPTFDLRMETEATDLIRNGNRATGVRTNRGDIAARLVIACDGRESALRKAARLPLIDLRASIDVLWFRVPKPKTGDNRSQFFFGAGEIMIAIDRTDYFQCARVIPKGAAKSVRRLGLQRFRSDVGRVAPPLAGWLDSIDDWDQIKLLSVSFDRLERWWRPGFLAIGDAAHAMSPVGGVGVNLAVQDAVAAANILAQPLLDGEDIDDLLQNVQERRMKPVERVQEMQRAIHDHVIGRALSETKPKTPFLIQLADAIPWLRRIPAKMIGLGVRPEHIRSPDAFANDR